MRVGLLGPVRVEVGGEVIAVAGARLRASSAASGALVMNASSASALTMGTGWRSTA